MTEPKFRARDLQGKWCYSNQLEQEGLWHTGYKALETFFHWLWSGNLDPATLGQWTGRKECEAGGIVEAAKDLYGDDRVHFHMFYFDGSGEAEKEGDGVIVWSEEESGWLIKIDGRDDDYVYFSDCDSIKVTGSIHDAPKSPEIPDGSEEKP